MRLISRPAPTCSPDPQFAGTPAVARVKKLIENGRRTKQVFTRFGGGQPMRTPRDGGSRQSGKRRFRLAAV